MTLSCFYELISLRNIVFANQKFTIANHHFHEIINARIWLYYIKKLLLKI